MYIVEIKMKKQRCCGASHDLDEYADNPNNLASEQRITLHLNSWEK
jgi:hypothetical protein